MSLSDVLLPRAHPAVKSYVAVRRQRWRSAHAAGFPNTSNGRKCEELHRNFALDMPQLHLSHYADKLLFHVPGQWDAWNIDFVGQVWQKAVG